MVMRSPGLNHSLLLFQCARHATTNHATFLTSVQSAAGLNSGVFHGLTENVHVLHARVRARTHTHTHTHTQNLAL